MATLDELVVRIKADTSQLESALKNSTNIVANNTKKMEGQFAGLGKSIKSMGLEVGGLGAILGPVIGAVGVKQVIEYSDAWKGLTNRLRLVSESSVELAGLQERLFDIAQDTRSSLDATVTLYQRLTFATKGLGISQEEVLTFTEQLNKQLLVGGLSATEASASVFQLTQAFNKGKLDGDEFRTILESAPPILEALQKSLGVTRGEILAMAADGKLGPKVLVDAVNEMANVTDERFKDLDVTVGQAFQQLENAFTKFIGQSGEVNNATSGIADGLQFLAENIDLVGRSALALATVMGVRLAIGIGASLALMNPLALGLAAVVGGMTFLATATTAAQKEQMALNKALSEAESVSKALEESNYALGNASGEYAKTLKLENDVQRDNAKLRLDSIKTMLLEEETRLKLLNSAEMGIDKSLSKSGVRDSLTGLIDRRTQGDIINEQIDSLKKLGDMYKEVNRLEGALAGGTGNAGAITKGASTTSETNSVKSAKKANEALAERKRILDAIQTPQEKYTEALSEAELLYEKGTITLEEFNRYQEKLAEGFDKVGDSATINAKIISDKFGDALESAAFDFDNFGDSARKVLEGLARDLARKNIIDPFTSAASDALGGAFKETSFGDFFSGLGFASGGNPPVGMASMVGERGPELFVPKTAGTIVPNHALGGGNITVNVVNNNGSQVSVQQTKNTSGQSIEVRIDELVAKNISQQGTMTNQALRAVQSRSLIKR